MSSYQDDGGIQNGLNLLQSLDSKHHTISSLVMVDFEPFVEQHHSIYFYWPGSFGFRVQDVKL